MNIQMIGIDHSKAQLQYREIFSFTKTHQIEALQSVRGKTGVQGCVILSTCNRMELYVSTTDEVRPDLYRLICDLKGIDSEEYRSLFTERAGKDAAAHLFYLASGMESRILGEDQIITQVKDALNLARENDATDKVLEVLFRMAVTAGKKVRTEVAFSHGNTSAIHGALDRLKEKGYAFAGQQCLVIGNGEMGRLAGQALKAEGADVTVTVRQYRSGEVRIPSGCETILYGDRFEKMKVCRYVISATASPNLTVEAEDLKANGVTGPKTFIDLAVPRDIDPAIGQMDGMELYDIDAFGADRMSEEQRSQYTEAMDVIEDSLKEFTSWYECIDYLPMIKTLGRLAAEDVNWRMGRYYKDLDLPEEKKALLEEYLTLTSEKVFDKLLFKLRDNVSTDMLRECLEAMTLAFDKK